MRSMVPSGMVPPSKAGCRSSENSAEMPAERCVDARRTLRKYRSWNCVFRMCRPGNRIVAMAGADDSGAEADCQDGAEIKAWRVDGFSNGGSRTCARKKPDAAVEGRGETFDGEHGIRRT